jgi:hypothetical protein
MTNNPSDIVRLTLVLNESEVDILVGILVHSKYHTNLDEDEEEVVKNVLEQIA